MVIQPRPSALLRLDTYFASGRLVPNVLIWATTALFLGFSLGIAMAHFAARNGLHCIEGQSLVAPPGH